ncbi:probable translation initiation factor eIF-2B subunit delta isoform X2 [Phragmites australis]|uniref:probable translation initiation factor eIF-2B subunit delta isoform X2 n=1 Tax=Phragmites australis TaxID=29695 RepID=UPI002D7A027E|nr:probable translation initiation factor eIF-2B subunit delta isoform X2 [Phragmites australis]
MDIRRTPPRSSSGGGEPRFRQVGFVTSAEPAAAPAPSAHAPSSSPPAAHLSPGPLSPVMIPPPRIPDHLPVPAPASESIMPSSPPPASSSRLDASSDLEDDDVDVSWARPPPPALLEPNKRDLTETKNEGAPTSVPQKSKLSKAERRAIQEAQRAAKAAAKDAVKIAGLSGKSTAMASGASTTMSKQPKTAKTSLRNDVTQVNPPIASDKKTGQHPRDKDRKKDAPHPRMQFDDVHRVENTKRHSVVNKSETQNRIEMFGHLPQYAHGTQLPDLKSKFFLLDAMHPSVYKVGLQYLSGDISGDNARCIAMLLSFKEAINDYSTPAEKTLDRDLPAKISSYVSFLVECRPLSISMGNAIRFLKNRIAKLPLTLSESEAKASLQSDIDGFINGKIIVADKVIVSHAITKIRDDDVLLTYGSPSVVEMIFDHAHELGKKFRVAVVDSRPNLEGQRLLRRLVAKGISCTYTHINAVSYIMHEVTRVFVGASSVLSNGTIYSRVGTASVAMVAHAFQVPVLVCCEAYKFHERVQLDSICFNELGDPDAISRVPGGDNLSHLKNWVDIKNLQVLNLKYDITPSDYVSMLITEYGMLPPTSVPVVLREYRREHIWI